MAAKNWTLQTVDSGVLAFDRSRGMNLLLRNEQTSANQRSTPRSLQIGLLSPCNLSCDFCYRDTGAPSRLTAEFLIDLLQKASDWGVLEVSFGGGEPLLFKGFVDLARKLHETTSLGINFTTNGMLLTPAVVHELEDAIGEIRVSAYLDNHYRRTLRRLAGRQVGLNLLVTPEKVNQLEAIVMDALQLGARNVLLLGYKGTDPRLHLSDAELDQLRNAVRRLQHIPLRMDICWYPLLSDLPHLFPRSDCGAGNEFLVITPDRAIQPCSFHHERIPFDSFEDLQRIYDDLRVRRPSTTIGGCTRQQFLTLGSSQAKSEAGLWMWEARSSNNSGDWTIVGRFRSAELARDAAEALRRLSRAHEAFLASPEGNTWIKEHDYYGTWPTPPLQKFGEAHGFDWSEDGDGLWWEEDGCGAPVLTAGAVGDAVVVYHPYCMGLPEAPFKNFFGALGATEFGYWQYDRPSVIATARGENPDAFQAVEHYLSLIHAADYPGEVKDPPPWGATCDDPRLLDDEDRSTRLARGANAVQVAGDQLRISLSFENTLAGALAIERWLRSQNYSEVEVRVDHLVEPLAPAAARVSPQTKLFSEAVPLESRLRSMSNAEKIDTLFAYHSTAPKALEEAVSKIVPEERIQLARLAWQKRRSTGFDVHWRALLVIESAGSPAAEWLRDLWSILLKEDFQAIGVAFRAMAAVLPAEEAFSLAQPWLNAAKDRQQYGERLKVLYTLSNPGTVALIESWWNDADLNVPITDDWGRLAAVSKIGWPTVQRWLDKGRPHSLIALAALNEYAAKGPPPEFIKPGRSDMTAVLTGYAKKDTAPRASTTVNRIIGAITKISLAD